MLHTVAPTLLHDTFYKMILAKTVSTIVDAGFYPTVI
jgi:hypothetical protein